MGKAMANAATSGGQRRKLMRRKIAANPAVSPRASPETIVASPLPHSISHAAGPCTQISKFVAKAGKALSPLLLLEAWVPRMKFFAPRHFASHPAVLEVIQGKEREPDLSSPAEGLKKSSEMAKPCPSPKTSSCTTPKRCDTAHSGPTSGLVGGGLQGPSPGTRSSVSVCCLPSNPVDLAGTNGTR